MTRKFPPPPTKFGKAPAQPKPDQQQKPPPGSPRHHAPPPAAPLRALPGASGNSAQAKPAPCGCGGPKLHGVIQRTSIAERTKARHFVSTSKRENMRSVTRAKEMLDEFKDGSGKPTIKKPEKKKKVCDCPPNARPRTRGWKAKMWDGHSRRRWSAAAQALRVGLCVQCNAAPGAELDHVVQYQQHISDNAPLYLFCDGVCHFYGIRTIHADQWYNDVDNLEFLCRPCHNAKPNRRDLAIPPTVISDCPHPGRRGADCGANYRL